MSILDVTIWKYTVKNFLEHQKHFANPISLVPIPARSYQHPKHHELPQLLLWGSQWPQLCRSKDESLELNWFLLSGAFCTVELTMLFFWVAFHPYLLRHHSHSVLFLPHWLLVFSLLCWFSIMNEMLQYPWWSGSTPLIHLTSCPKWPESSFMVLNTHKYWLKFSPAQTCTSILHPATCLTFLPGCLTDISNLKYPHWNS